MAENIIWDWIIRLDEELQEAGQGQVAKLIDQFSTEVCELNMEKVDAMLPEAIALSRSLNNPWLEVFFRHWEMRNRVGNRVEGEVALADAVKYFEMAHREETYECPQSVCLTQDLTDCYANIDGPGWVEERKAVVEEMMERITPHWNCFRCLSVEYIEALADEEKYEEALAYIALQEAKLQEAGVKDDLQDSKIDIYIKQERYSEAYELLQAKKLAKANEYQWEKWRQLEQVDEAYLLAMLGNEAEAREKLVPWGQLAPLGYRRWIRTIEQLVTLDAGYNNWQVSGLIQSAIDHFEKVGSYRHLIEMAEIQIRLALKRGSTWYARRALTQIKSAIPQLRKQDGMDALFAELEKAIAVQKATVNLPVEADELVEWLNTRGEAGEGRNPEMEIEWLLEAITQLPDNEALVGNAASALFALEAKEEAERLLWNYVRKHRADDSITAMLSSRLMDEGRFNEVEEIEQFFDPESDLHLWAKARRLRGLRDYDAAQAVALKMHEKFPDYIGPISMMVAEGIRLQQFPMAVEWLLKQEALMEDPKNTQWDILTYASAAQNWELAREYAEKLGIKLESTEGPIEEEWGMVSIRYYEEGNIVTERYAQCTGPVTARIIQPTSSGQAQKMGDWVVFDAEHLVERPEDPEEHFIPCFRAVHTLEKGGYHDSWFADGAYPGQADFDLFRDTLREEGYQIWVFSPDDYQVRHPDDEDRPLEGVYFNLTAPLSMSPKAVYHRLTELTKEWEHPLAWYGLAKDAGMPVEPHQNIIERYGL